MKNQQYLNICKELIEKKLGWGPPENWKYSDFNELSQQIKDASGISISNRTLEYLFKKEDRAHNPQNATKNALAVYLGFENWHDLINNYKSVEHKIVDSSAKLHTTSKRKTILKLLIPTLLIVGILAGYYFFNNIYFDNEIYLTATPKVEQAPMNVFVKYKIPDVEKDLYQIFVDDQNLFSEMKNTTITKKEGHLVYSVPFSGYYTARLLKNSRIIDKTSFHALSDGWGANIFQRSKRYPLPAESLISDKFLAVKTNSSLPEDIDTSDEFFLTFINSQEFDVNGDNLNLKAVLENNTETKGDSCFDAGIELFCENGRMRIKSVSKDCEEWVVLDVSNSYNIGKFNDFSSLTFNNQAPVEINIRTKNKTFYIQVNNQAPVEIKYETTLGDVKTIYVNFKGFGVLHEFTLTNLQTNQKTTLTPMEYSMQ